MNSFITQEGKQGVLQKAFGEDSSDVKFEYLALGERGTNLASITGNDNDFQEVVHSTYTRIKAEPITTNSDGSITMTFTVDENNYKDENSIDINEIALFDSATGGTAFAYCEVPVIAKNNNVSLKYTLKISID